MCFILISIASFVLRTLTIFEIADYDFITVYTSNNLTIQTPVNNRQQREIIKIFDTIELICMNKNLCKEKFLIIYFVFLGNSWFIFEITLRFLVAPSKRIFCASILNWIGNKKQKNSFSIEFFFFLTFILDFLGTFWFCFTYILYNIFLIDRYNPALDLLSTIRVTRMFKLCNLHPRLKVIIISMSYSSSVLSLLIFFFFLAIIIAGSSMYYVERLSNSSDNQLISIVEGIWLAISTISTLGFGDTVPKSLFGMILGAITTVLGVLIIDLPMPIIVETFANFNSHVQARQQLPKQRRRITPAVMTRKIKPQIPPNGHLHQHRI